MKVLIVEDEIIPAHYLKKVLVKNGYEVLDIVMRGAEAIQVAKTKKPDVILMDVMLKDNISGCDAALEISLRDPKIRIIFLTAYSDKEMIEFAVESKAFAYLLKPYRDKEILATLELAKIRQEESKAEPEQESTTHIALADGYHFDTISNTLFKGTQEVPCGPKALQLIALLCEHAHGTVKIETLLEELWDTDTSQQTLRSLIHRVREKTSDNLILNVNKLGYKIGLKD